MVVVEEEEAVVGQESVEGYSLIAELFLRQQFALEREMPAELATVQGEDRPMLSPESCD